MIHLEIQDEERPRHRLEVKNRGHLDNIREGYLYNANNEYITLYIYCMLEREYENLFTQEYHIPRGHISCTRML